MDWMPKVILLISASGKFQRQIITGISNYAHLHGPWKFYSEPGNEKGVLPQLKDWGANGVIADIDSPDKIANILEADIPVITCGTQVDGAPFLHTAPVMVAGVAAEHLLGLGFKNFAYCGMGNLDWTIDRGEKFVQKIAEAGFKTHVFSETDSDVEISWSKDQQHLANWLIELPKPIAVFACNDSRGRHVVEACASAEIRVPDEVAVLGAHNDELVCGLCEPPLSSIALNAERGGYEAAELLDKMMKDLKDPTEELFVYPLHVVQRQSTSTLAIEDKTVVSAVRFIWQNCSRHISVDDVAEAACLSRRVLEKRFRTILKRSILVEIRAARAEQITKMLLNTNIPISQIAFDLDFNGVDHIARYFKKEKGMSPFEYRKMYGLK